MKKAIVTGCPGQDASYLIEFLLKNDYQVVGTYRYSSTPFEQRFKNYPKENEDLLYECVDIVDASACNRLIDVFSPDEVYNLAAASHVGQSFKNPASVFDVNTKAVINLMEAIRVHKPDTKFLTCSTSEMFGSNYTEDGYRYQDENTPFQANSPYSAAKIAAHNMIDIYRRSYDMFVTTAISFNHECFYSKTPLVIKDEAGLVDVRYISDLVANRKDITKDSNSLTKIYSGDLKVWDGTNWVNIKAVSRKKLNVLDEENRKIVYSRCKGGMVATTPNHKFIDSNGNRIQQRDMKEQDTILKNGRFPELEAQTDLTVAFSKFLGMLAGDGYVCSKGSAIRFSNQNELYRNEFFTLAKECGFATGSRTYTRNTSGFSDNSCYIELSGYTKSQAIYLRELLYDKRTKHKKVPRTVINTCEKIKNAFYDGYYLADGLKTCNYQSFKSNSPLLAQGLLLIKPRTFTVHDYYQNGKMYTKVDFVNRHYKYGPEVFLHQTTIDKENQHVFDIETDSGVVNAGVGTLVIGNSPRRGENFVTRKITKWMGEFSRWKNSDNYIFRYPLEIAKFDNDFIYASSGDKFPKLRLGNIESVRDWSHARDIIKGMYAIMQHKEPDDFVLCSGRGYSVKNFLKAVFSYVGIDDHDSYWCIDKQFYRPCEVEFLQGSSAKAKDKLGWEPKISFDQLVKEMVDADIK